MKKITLYSSVLVLVLSVLVSGAPQVLADSTGLKTPTSTHTPNNWDTNTVGNAQSSDNVYVSDNDNESQGYSNFTLGVSSGVNIAGIEVIVEAKSSDSSGCELDADLSWNNGSNYASAKTAH